MIYVGTCGWDYAHWRSNFYPRDLPQRSRLAFYASQFPAVELDGTFYRLPKRETFRSWAASTPDQFCFAVKASRFLTHMRRLRQPREPVQRLLGAAGGLGQQLGPVLLQLPPNMAPDASLLADALAEFGDVPVAVEFRDERWYRTDVRRVLERSHAALCWADRKSRLVTPPWRTADWGYLRLHYGRGRPEGNYGDRALAAHAHRLRETFGARATVHVYFNNDGHACAPRNARTFQRLAEREGLEVARPTAAPPATRPASRHHKRAA